MIIMREPIVWLPFLYGKNIANYKTRLVPHAAEHSDGFFTLVLREAQCHE